MDMYGYSPVLGLSKPSIIGRADDPCPSPVYDAPARFLLFSLSSHAEAHGSTLYQYLVAQLQQNTQISGEKKLTRLRRR